jgi:hypothetical protein
MDLLDNGPSDLQAKEFANSPQKQPQNISSFFCANQQQEGEHGFYLVDTEA